MHWKHKLPSYTSSTVHHHSSSLFFIIIYNYLLLDNKTQRLYWLRRIHSIIRSIFQVFNKLRLKSQTMDPKVNSLDPSRFGESISPMTHVCSVHQLYNLTMKSCCQRTVAITAIVEQACTSNCGTIFMYLSNASDKIQHFFAWRTSCKRNTCYGHYVCLSSVCLSVTFMCQNGFVGPSASVWILKRRRHFASEYCYSFSPIVQIMSILLYTFF